MTKGTSIKLKVDSSPNGKKGQYEANGLIKPVGIKTKKGIIASFFICCCPIQPPRSLRANSGSISFRFILPTNKDSIIKKIPSKMTKLVKLTLDNKSILTSVCLPKKSNEININK